MKNDTPRHRTTRNSSQCKDLEAKYRRARIANIVLAALVAFLGVVVVAQMQSGSTNADLEANQNGAPAEPLARRAANDTMAMGSLDAPVVLVEWADLRCPFCAVFSRETLPILIEEYIKPGKVRLEFNDVSFFGEQSEDAAVAARAAGEQGRYFEFVFAVYDAAPEKGHPDLPREKLIAFAMQAGVPDIDRFTADLDRDDLRAPVQASTARAQGASIGSVPFFVAGGIALAGAQPIEAFRQLLDDAIARAG